MKGMLKKAILITIISIVFIPLTKVSAVSYDVKTVTASYASGTISYSGTTDNGVLAVTCRLYDSNNQELYMKSSQVNNNKFNDTFTASAGTYTVSCANYDGGAVVTTDVDDKIEITDIKITLENPTPGDKVTVIEVDEGGFGYTEPDKLATASTNTTGLKVDAAHYIKGTCLNNATDCEEYFEGTFEEDKDYYVMIYVSTKDGYKLTTNSLNSIKINGEDPEEIFTIYSDITGATNTMFIAKIKATTQESNTTTNETTSPKTNDTITMYIALLAISAVGIISTIYLRKRKVNVK